MIQNLPEDFMYQRLPSGVVDLDTQGLIQAVCAGIQSRIEDLRSYSKNLQLFFAVNNFPQTGPNVVLVDLQSAQGKMYTRSLDIQSDTPADGTAALADWAAVQLGLDETDIIDARYGVDLLRLVDINTLSYLAQTIGAVLYKTSIIPDDQIQAEQQQIIATYFPRLHIKGTEKSFDALGRILGFDDIRMTPLWSRLSVRQPSDVGAAANDPDFATEPEYLPQQYFSPFYNPLKTDDGPFYTWTGTANNRTSSTQFYTQVVNGFNPYVETLVLAAQYGTVVDPANGAYSLGSSGTSSLGGPHKKAYVDPPGATVRFQAIAEGADFNGMVINVGTDSTGTNKILSITDRLSAVKYRSSYFDLAITADLDKIEEILGSSAAQRNKDLAADPMLTTDGTAISPYRPWIGGSLATGSVVQDWITQSGTVVSITVVPRGEASAINRQLNMDSVTAAGVQVTQAMEEVRAATRIPRKSLSGLLWQDPVGYAPFASPRLLGTTTTTFIYVPNDTANLTEAVWITNVNDVLYATDGNLFYSSLDAIHWTPLGSVADTVTSFIYSNSLFVAVGLSGVIYTSSDATTWAQQTSPTTNNLYDIIYAAGRYVAVGDNGTVLTSVNAVSWSLHAAPVGFEGLFSVVYARGTYVAVGGGGFIVTSSDASTWLAQTSGVISTLFQAMADDSSFYAVGVAGVLLASSNGVVWSPRAGDPNDLRAMLLLDRRYYYTASAEATIYQSLDAVIWTEIPVKAGPVGPFVQLIPLGKSTVVVLSQGVDPYIFPRDIADEASISSSCIAAVIPSGYMQLSVVDNTNFTNECILANVPTGYVLAGSGTSTVDRASFAGSLISASISGSFQRNGADLANLAGVVTTAFIYGSFPRLISDFTNNLTAGLSSAHVP